MTSDQIVLDINAIRYVATKDILHGSQILSTCQAWSPTSYPATILDQKQYDALIAVRDLGTYALGSSRVVVSYL